MAFRHEAHLLSWAKWCVTYADGGVYTGVNVSRGSIWDRFERGEPSSSGVSPMGLTMTMLGYESKIEGYLWRLAKDEPKIALVIRKEYLGRERNQELKAQKLQIGIRTYAKRLREAKLRIAENVFNDKNPFT